MNRYLKIAKKESEKSEQYHRLGCVITQKGKVLGKGFNKAKTHSTYGSGFASYLHAEGAAVISALGRVHSLKGCTAYIYRRNSLKSKPCKDCMELLTRMGIKRIIYTIEQGIEQQTL